MRFFVRDRSEWKAICSKRTVWLSVFLFHWILCSTFLFRITCTAIEFTGEFNAKRSRRRRGLTTRRIFGLFFHRTQGTPCIICCTNTGKFENRTQAKSIARNYLDSDGRTRYSLCLFPKFAQQILKSLKTRTKQIIICQRNQNPCFLFGELPSIPRTSMRRRWTYKDRRRCRRVRRWTLFFRCRRSIRVSQSATYSPHAFYLWCFSSASQLSGMEAEEDTSNERVATYKVGMLGASGVGKTALTAQFTTSDYICAYDTSLGEYTSRIPLFSIVAEISTFLFVK